MHSIRPDKPIDPVTIAILRAVTEEATAEKIATMLVGATARDIMLTHVFGLAPSRLTRDVDFAVAVQDWPQFDVLRGRLVRRATFKAGRIPQRLYYKGEDGNEDYELDLVPFGGVTDGTNQVAWPPDMKVIMNVAGFDDVLQAAELIEFTPGLIGNVVSLAGLAVLKIIAWSDRGRQNPKDALDLQHLMESYAEAGNWDRVYEDADTLETVGFDQTLAGIVLLGADIKRVASKDTLVLLQQIINADFHRLVTEMVKPRRLDENALERVEARLRLLLRGMA